MKKWLIGNFILIILVFLIWPDHDKKEDAEFGNMKDPISDIGYADPDGIELSLNSLDGINKDNAVQMILDFYGLELNVPETWIVEDVKAEMKDMDSKTEITFSNVTDEEYTTYVTDFYSKNHLGDDDISKYKLKDGTTYSWTVQIEGVSIKDTYSLKKEEGKLILIIEKTF